MTSSRTSAQASEAKLKAPPPHTTKAPAAKAVPVKTAGTRKVAAKKIAAQPAPLPKTTKASAPKVAAQSVKEKSTDSKSKSTKKAKLVRDSFTMPKDEYQAIEVLKQRATRLQRPAKKSELLRAGIKALTAMDDKQFAVVLSLVPALKTGRPVRS